MTSDDLIDVEVDRAAMVARDVLAVDLVSATNEPLPSWQPGAHVELHLPSGLLRTYSLCGDPTDRTRYRLAVLRVADGRGGSRELHDLDWTAARDAGRGLGLRISPPRNHFELVAADSYLFIAGGIGITPLLPMVGRAAALGVPWTLVYGGRTRESMAFWSEVASLAGGQVRLVPQDTEGLIDVDQWMDDAPDTCEMYVCGPPGLLDAAQDAAGRHGATRRLHVERFTASERSVGDATNTGFDVELRRSAVTVHVAPSETILAKVLEVNPGHPWSCEEGICGSCETTVLSGEVDHRDEILDDGEREANDTMFICVSRSRGPHLILDL